jgi:hypothetical protein
MNETKYRHAEIRGSHRSSPLRSVIVKDHRVSRKRAEYYTGIHDDGPEELRHLGMWSKDPWAAVSYAHMVLATNDLIALRSGRLPEGRRGMRTEDRWYD